MLNATLQDNEYTGTRIFAVTMAVMSVSKERVPRLRSMMGLLILYDFHSAPV